MGRLTKEQRQTVRDSVLAGMIKAAATGDTRAAGWLESKMRAAEAEEASEAGSSPALRLVSNGDRSAVVTTRIAEHVREALAKMAKTHGLTVSGLAAQILAGAVALELPDDEKPAAPTAIWDAGY